MQNIKLQTPEGIREYLFIPGTAEYDAAREAGEISVGMDIVYKNYLVGIIDGFAMLVLEMIRGIPQFDPGMPNMDSFSERVPNMDGFTMEMPDMTNGHFSFTVNGRPVSQDEFEAAMGGIPRQ